jgi:hypothetical protein
MPVPGILKTALREPRSMNTKFLVVTSFLLALLCHLFIFNYCVVVFPISPEAFKPKFFFLGPILKQSDIKNLSAPETVSREYSYADRMPPPNNADPMAYETADPEKNPFTIRAIRKPLIPETVKSEEKAVLKSTFDTSFHKEIPEGIKTEPPQPELQIQPYRPLRFGTDETGTPGHLTE